MASSYTPLGIELQATGENAGTWGTKTNTNLLSSIEGGHLNILPPPRGQGPPSSTTKSLDTAALLSFQKVSSI